MYLVGDVVKFPSSHGKEISGEVVLVEEQTDNSYSYVINSDDGIAIRNSEDDHEMSLVNDPVLDF